MFNGLMFSVEMADWQVGKIEGSWVVWNNKQGSPVRHGQVSDVTRI